MKYQIITTIFTGASGADYTKLLNGFITSVKKNCKDVRLIVVRLPRPRKTIDRRGQVIETVRVNNRHKMEHWQKVIADISMPTILMDADMVVLQDLHGVFDHDFDIAITTKRKSKVWLNGGFVAVKPTANAKNIVSKWSEYDKLVYEDASLRKHIEFTTGVVGQNQVSFAGYQKELKKLGKIIELPCREWNMTPSIKGQFTKDTKVIHVMSSLRTFVQTLNVYTALQQTDPVKKELAKYF